MDYKKIIKSRSAREKILRLLAFIPDEQMLKIQYRIKTGRRLDLNNPKRFTEKLQWYKLYYRDPLMKTCVDKYDVREYIKNCGLRDILIDDFGVYDSVESICLDKLPNSFVVKDTLGGGGNSVIVCEDKEKFDIDDMKSQMRKWLAIKSKSKNSGREWVYEDRKHRIYIEDYIQSDQSKGGLIDYKFFCFYGKAEYLYVIADRKMGSGAGLGIFTSDYKRLDVRRCDERPLTRDIEKPTNFDELISVAERIAKPFPEARIDLYDVEGKIYFGEITFFDGSGYMTFEPDSFDYEIGAKFELPPPDEFEGYGYVAIIFALVAPSKTEVAA